MIQYHSLSGFASYCESGAINGYHQYENGPKLSISRVLNIEACFSSLNISFLTTFFKVFFSLLVGSLGMARKNIIFLIFREVWDGPCIVWVGQV